VWKYLPELHNLTPTTDFDINDNTIQQILDQRSVLELVSWYDMTLMDEQTRRSDQSAVEVARMSSSSEGSTTAAVDLMGLEIDPGGDTSHAKRVLVFGSSVDVSARPKCLRPADGHIYDPDQPYYLNLSVT
jgi:hypothetical protein